MLLGRVKEVMPEQFSNAYSPMEAMVLGMFNADRWVQFLNAWLPMEVTSLWKVTECKPVEPVKAKSLISDTLLGMVKLMTSLLLR